MYADDDAFYEEIEKLKAKADDFSKEYKDIETVEEVSKSLREYSEIIAIVDKLGTFAGISMEVDTTDDHMAKRYARLGNELSKVFSDLSFYEPALSRLDKKILGKLSKRIRILPTL